MTFRGVSTVPRDAGDKVTSSSVKEGPTWVPLKDAAGRAGVSVSTLRNWDRKGRIEARTVRGPNGEQRLVRIDEVLALRGKRDPAGQSTAGEWIPLRDASLEAGVSISTLRNWYRKGLVDSRMETGPNGDQRLVRKDQVLARSNGQARSNGAARSATPPVEPETSGSELVPVARALPDLIKELADARERAGRAETKAEFLSEQLSEARARAEKLERVVTTLEKVRVSDQPQETFEPSQPTPEIEDDLPADFPREEDDEYLALVQRWRARRKRRRMLKRAAKSRSS